jgi:hypothetical protein
MKRYLFLLFLIFISQTHLYSSQPAPYMFNLQNFTTAGSGIFILDVGHRYFDVNRHTTNVNISLIYGICNILDITTAYSFKNKDIVGAGKLNILDDFSQNDILSISIYGGMGYKDTNQVNNSISLSYANKDQLKSKTTLDSKDRFSYFGQLIIQKHFFSNRVSLGLVPTYAYNTNFYQIETKIYKDYSVGAGFMAELLITDRTSIAGELIMNYAGFAFKYMNYNVGLKYSGYRHTFSLWLTNSYGYSPVEYITGNENLTPKISAAFTREFD